MDILIYLQLTYAFIKKLSELLQLSIELNRKPVSAFASPQVHPDFMSEIVPQCKYCCRIKFFTMILQSVFVSQYLTFK